MIFKSRKKSAALLIALLIITAVAIIALTMAKSVLSGLRFTTSISDGMIAEEASKTGLEYGLLLYKSNKNVTGAWRINLDTNDIKPLPSTSPPASQRTADVTISGTDGKNKKIESIGYFGRVQKKHTLSQGAQLPGGTEKNFQASQDAMVAINGPSINTNYGQALGLFVGYDNLDLKGVMRSYIQFDTSSIPSGSTIINATLSLYLNVTSRTGTQEIYKVTSDWNETIPPNITGNNQPTSEATSILRTATVGEASGWKEWDITTLVQSWVNNSNKGLMIRDVNEASSGFSIYASSNAPSGNFPKLTIIYTPK